MMELVEDDDQGEQSGDDGERAYRLTVRPIQRLGTRKFHFVVGARSKLVLVALVVDARVRSGTEGLTDISARNAAVPLAAAAPFGSVARIQVVQDAIHNHAHHDRRRNQSEQVGVGVGQLHAWFYQTAVDDRRSSGDLVETAASPEPTWTNKRPCEQRASLNRG